MVEQERTTLRRARRLLVDGNNVVGGRDEGRIAAVEAALCQAWERRTAQPAP